MTFAAQSETLIQNDGSWLKFYAPADVEVTGPLVFTNPTYKSLRQQSKEMCGTFWSTNIGIISSLSICAGIFLLLFVSTLLSSADHVTGAFLTVIVLMVALPVLAIPAINHYIARKIMSQKMQRHLETRQVYCTRTENQELPAA